MTHTDAGIENYESCHEKTCFRDSQVSEAKLSPCVCSFCMEQSMFFTESLEFIEAWGGNL